LVGRPEGKGPLGKPRRGWEDSIRLDLKEFGWVSVDWMHLDQDGNQWWALVSTVISLWAP